MRLVIFGLSITSSWGNGHATTYRSLLPALAARGHQIVFYERDVEYYALRRDFDRLPYADLRLYSELDGIRHEMLREARSADVVMTTSFCPDGAAIQRELFEVPGPLNVFYDLDAPVTLAGLNTRSAATLAYLLPEHIPQFDLYLSFTGGPLLNELSERWGAQRVVPLYLCVDPDQFRREENTKFESCALSFVGTYSADRQPAIERLLLEPASMMPEHSFTLAGPLYPQEMRKPPNLRHIHHLSAHDLPAFYSASAFTLNVTREAMRRTGYSPQGRLFEAACCEATILTDEWPGLEEFFTPQEELLVVDSAADVCDAIRHASPEDRRRMGRHARERVAAMHSGEQRAQELEHALSEIQTTTAAN